VPALQRAQTAAPLALLGALAVARLWRVVRASPTAAAGSVPALLQAAVQPASNCSTSVRTAPA
jgi:hypothetical protein